MTASSRPSPVPPLQRLADWEGAGAVWRAALLDERRAIVDLCTCTGEPVERLESSDPELIAYLRERPASDG